MTTPHRKLKICFLASSFYPVIGGAESYALNVIEGLAKKGHEILVITDYIEMSFVPLNIPSVEVVRIKDYDSLYHDKTKIRWEQMYFALLNDISQVLKNRHIDLLHTNSQDSAILGSMIARSLEIPLVASMHEHDPESEPFGRGRCKLIYEHLPIQRILVGSQFYAQRAQRYCNDPQRIAFIYHGIDIATFSPTVNGAIFRERLQLSDEQFLIVSAGRLKHRKGHLELIQVVQNLVERIPNFHVLIAGSRSSTQVGYAETLYDIIQKQGLKNLVTIDEHLTPREMPDVYAAADLVVHPSYEEGLGLTVLEAMSARVPVVTTRVPGIIEIMKTGQEALLVDSPKDIQGLTQAIMQIYEDTRLREKLVQQAYQTVEAHFSLQRMITEIENLYYELVDLK